MKKQYWLALGWWAARWLAHLWVIKYLEEQNIRVKEISGTSMWAVVAAMFAIWKTSSEMIDFAKSINYITMWDPDFKTGLLKWKKIEKKLKEVFGDKRIEDLEIPLRIVATNLETSESRVFKEWKIVDALRASISLPGIFIHKHIEGHDYVDGWIMMNLPIEALGKKNVIAVSALKINWLNICWNSFSFLWKTIFYTSFSIWHLIWQIWIFTDKIQLGFRSWFFSLITIQEVSIERKMQFYPGCHWKS